MRGTLRLDLTGLHSRLKLEVQYVVHSFLDHGPRRIRLARWNAVARALGGGEACSLLDRTAEDWVSSLYAAKGNPDGALFLYWGRDRVDWLINDIDWDREYPLHTRLLDRFGHAATGVDGITFTSIEAPWLRALAK